MSWNDILLTWYGQNAYWIAAIEFIILILAILLWPV